MERINSVQIRSNGVKKTFRSNEEKLRIISQIDNSNMKKWESCLVLGVTQGQVSVWRRKLVGKNTVVKEPVNKKVLTDFDVFMKESESKIELMFQEWKRSDIISQLRNKITTENTPEICTISGKTPTEITLFLQRKKDLPFSCVDKILKYLG